MSNDEIIYNIAVSIYGKDEVMEMLEHGQDIPIHTAHRWRKIGPYKVKEGEKPIMTKLWKIRHSTKDSSDTQKPQFYLSKAFLFCREQVELSE